jgi:hypothetical protein
MYLFYAHFFGIIMTISFTKCSSTFDMLVLATRTVASLNRRQCFMPGCKTIRPWPKHRSRLCCLRVGSQILPNPIITALEHALFKSPQDVVLTTAQSSTGCYALHTRRRWCISRAIAAMTSSQYIQRGWHSRTTSMELPDNRTC